MYKSLSLMTVWAAAFVSMTAAADGWTVFDGGWRVSAGAIYDSGVKTDLRVSPRQLYRGGWTPTIGALTKEQARDAAQKGSRDGNRIVYRNDRKGAESWFDPTGDSGSSGEDGSGRFDSYYLPASIWNQGSAFELSYAEYDQIISEQASFLSMERFSDGDSEMPGISVELSRNLFHDVEYGYGLDVAFAVQYFRRNDAFKAGSSWMIGSASRQRGWFNKTYDVGTHGGNSELAELLPYSSKGNPEYDEFYADILWGEDGSLGGDGSGPIALPGDDDGNGEGSLPDEDLGSSYGSMDVEGDYENLELILLARPYYDVFDWLRVNAMFGLVVSRQSMEMSFTMLRDGAVDYRSNRDFSQWDVYGVAGLGLMLYWNDFTLGADFMARFLDDEMMIEDRYYRGSVQRGRWMFKLSAGYEF